MNDLIKVKFDSITGQVKGYFPSFLNYSNIDEKEKTIDGEPYIEISQEAHQEGFGKKMCIIDGIYQEYVESQNLFLERVKKEKLRACQKYLEATDADAIAFIKYGRPLDSKIVENSKKAQGLKKKIRECVSLDELEKININLD